jgi:hypothetical protein
MGIDSAEELYQMVSQEVPVLEDFEDRFRREAAGYVEHNIGGPVEGIPRYIGEEIDEVSFKPTVEDAAMALGFMRVRDRQLENLLDDLEEESQYRVLDERSMLRGSEIQNSLKRQRTTLDSVHSGVRGVAGILSDLDESPFDPLMEGRKIYQLRDGPVMDDRDFGEPVEAYWPFGSDWQ